MQVRDAELKELLGDARFFSVTYRLFKLPEAIETLCEDYGQACKYLVSEHHCSQSNCWAGHCRAQGTVEPGAAGLGLGLPGLRSACLPACPPARSARPSAVASRLPAPAPAARLPPVCIRRAPSRGTPTATLWMTTTLSRPASGTRSAATQASRAGRACRQGGQGRALAGRAG